MSIEHKCPHFSTYVTKFLDGHERALVEYFHCYFLPKNTPRILTELIEFTVIYCSQYSTIDLSFTLRVGGGGKKTKNVSIEQKSPNFSTFETQFLDERTIADQNAPHLKWGHKKQHDKNRLCI